MSTDKPTPAIKTVITERDEPGFDRDMKAVTPAGEPNVTVVTMPWWKQALVRAGRVYVQGVLAFVTAGGSGLDEAVGIPLDQFGGAFSVAIRLSIGPAVVSLLQNTVEILSKLDITNPSVRA